jgi:uncharacterized RDD family membrane protein YckC
MSPSADSPYAPPNSEVRGVVLDPPTRERLATAEQRLRNFAIDILATYAIDALLSFTCRALGLIPFLLEHTSAVAVVILLIPTLYRMVVEAVWGRTLGKLVTGTRVVALDGGAPSTAQIVGRSFARMIPFEPLSFFGGAGRPVGWHDSLSRTRVIRIR